MKYIAVTKHETADEYSIRMLIFILLKSLARVTTSDSKCALLLSLVNNSPYS